MVIHLGAHPVSGRTQPCLSSAKLVELVGPLGHSPRICFSCISDGFGGWSSQGCRKVETSAERVICQCDHMTNFAIIFDPYAGTSKVQSETHEKILGIISFIGIGLSLGGLFLTLLTLLLFRYEVNDARCFCFVPGVH